jgi:hypothetical protein
MVLRLSDNLFDDDDAERLASFEGAIPDGIIDGRQYAGIVKNILEHLSELKADDYVSGMTFVMRCVNECYYWDEESNSQKVNITKAVDTVTALSYYILTLRDIIHDDDFAHFIQIQNDEVIPEIMSGAETIPYYDISKFDDAINGMLDMLEIDEDDDE